MTIIKFSDFTKKGKKMEINDIANAFLSIESMTNKKLQKLCYYAQAWHLALNDESLIDCEFEAWIHGPVCPELYHKYKHYGYSPIPKKEIPEVITEDKYVHEFIQSIFDIYGNMSGDDLEFLTHNEDPWVNARRGLQEWQSSHNPILIEDMKAYYKELIEEK